MVSGRKREEEMIEKKREVGDVVIWKREIERCVVLGRSEKDKRNVEKRKRYRPKNTKKVSGKEKRKEGNNNRKQEAKES